MFHRQNQGVFWLGGLVFALVVIAVANMEGQNVETVESQSADGIGAAEEIQIRGHLILSCGSYARFIPCGSPCQSRSPVRL